MKILYIFRSLAVWGGIERILVDKMNFMAERYGMDIYLLTSDQGSHPVIYHLSDRLHHEDLDICFYQQYRFHGLRRFVIAWKMNRQYRHLFTERLHIIQPDLIICTTADNFGIIAKVKGNIPLVVESHSICTRTLNHGRSWLQRLFYRHSFLRNLSKVNMVVALTEGDAKEWRKYHPQVMVIPNFIHPHEEHISEEHISDCSAKKAIFVGRFDYQKRVQDAILIWKKVRERHSDWVLEIYGDGEMHQEICSLASSVGGITIHQPTSQIFQAYRECSILISTSLFEPFGLVIPEAMSCGLPVVAFDCPYGPGDLITDERNGYLVKEGDLDAFVGRICGLIDNPKLRKAMGQTALMSSQRYTVEHIIPYWLQLFSMLLPSVNKQVSS